MELTSADYKDAIEIKSSRTNMKKTAADILC
jgi:hypothetical protein